MCIYRTGILSFTWNSQFCCVSHRMHPLLQAALSGYVLVDPEKLSERMWIYQSVKICYSYKKSDSLVDQLSHCF